MRPSTKTILYIAIAWLLIVCYSVLQTGAVESLVHQLRRFVNLDDDWKRIITFIYGLAVVSFIGGSQVPGVFLKRKTYVIQFLFASAFGLVLIFLTMFSGPMFTDFFEQYPVIALEYICIPYVFMVILDFHSAGRLGGFSFDRFVPLLRNIFFHPRRIMSEICYRRSVLYSLTIVFLVSSAWTIHSVSFSVLALASGRQLDVTLSRQILYHVDVCQALGIDYVLQAALIIPVAVLMWLLASILVCIISQRFGGNGTGTDFASLLGFTFMPSLLAILVDYLELGVHSTEGAVALKAVFGIFSFGIPLVVWPLLLAILAIKSSGRMNLHHATATAIGGFFPPFALMSLIFF